MQRGRWDVPVDVPERLAKRDDDRVGRLLEGLLAPVAHDVVRVRGGRGDERRLHGVLELVQRGDRARVGRGQGRHGQSEAATGARPPLGEI